MLPNWISLELNMFIHMIFQAPVILNEHLGEIDDLLTEEAITKLLNEDVRIHF